MIIVTVLVGKAVKEKRRGFGVVSAGNWVVVLLIWVLALHNNGGCWVVGEECRGERKVKVVFLT